MQVLCKLPVHSSQFFKLYNAVRCLCLAFGLNTQLLLIFSPFTFVKPYSLQAMLGLADATIKLNLFKTLSFYLALF